ncbi:hypothetical protein [Brevibacillus brevis]|uniref:hypothetical protein n=1 Tax=Brevibacillus brevis TaxID=1393 RepID=UPI000D0FEF01|nr:hypothetical protein [Brevibacillus brevis]PSJ63547.1 hypothetical protein C7J99_31305 [Brevibacillus brevis]RED33846.1 hypothetical protein DES34_10211 [Brevibacillus brevis]GEC93337.1 hypothetical protein BBR01nite_56680 [Brevibacillus brevis]VEF92584.1 Uncharacterised protein [Brevibacillus brevis]
MVVNFLQEKVAWKFPINEGESEGFNDPGMETFRGNPIDGLTREPCQNSLDAKNEQLDKPVEVHFNLHYLSSDKFPDRESFIKTLEACCERSKNDKKALEFFKNALRLMKSEVIPILKISDFYTTGLEGAENKSGNWQRLVKSVGVCVKSGTSGGSYGIGKYAPFVCSQLRTVFYGTKDLSGKMAFQGVSKLMSHENAEGKETRRTGYFGDVHDYQPILDLSAIDDFFHRSEEGTDIFVAGFKAESDWEQNVIRSVLEHFIVAIFENRLIVRVGNTEISSKTLPELIKSFTSDGEFLAAKYYKALTSGKSFSKTFTFENTGSNLVDLYVLTEKDCPKKVSMFRSTGMKIYDKRYRKTFGYSGVLIVRGDKLNEFLRGMEPPAHDKWNPELHDNPSLAKKIQKSIENWVSEMIDTLATDEKLEELDIDGLSQFLPFRSKNDDLSFEANTEGLKKDPKEIQIELVNRSQVLKVYSADSEVASASEISNRDNTVESEDFFSDNDKNNSDSNKRGRASDESDTKFSDKGKRTERPKTPNPIQSKQSKTTGLKSRMIKCIKPQEGVYFVRLLTDTDTEGFLNFYIMGEENKELAPIKSAIHNGKTVPIKSNGKIGPIKLTGGQSEQLFITLKDSLRVSLEVILHAN